MYPAKLVLRHQNQREKNQDSNLKINFPDLIRLHIPIPDLRETQGGKIKAGVAHESAFVKELTSSRHRECCDMELELPCSRWSCALEYPVDFLRRDCAAGPRFFRLNVYFPDCRSQS